MCVNDELKELIYRFFFAFSRLEFALKEEGFHHRDRYGSAQPDWKRFINQYQGDYVLCESAIRLLRNPPRKQIINRNGDLSWRDLTFNPNCSELKKISLLIRAVRNNLFHGGKHGERSWDDPDRVRFLLENSLEVMDSIADLGVDIRSHYRNEY